MKTYASRTVAALQQRYPRRSIAWQLRSRALDLSGRPLLMGIVNVTPDSFSDGGEFVDADAAVRHGLQLVADGADILDIGGESTRPGAQPVSEQEELDRTAAVVDQLTVETDVPVSIDTSKAAVAREALRAGAQIINDVTGLEGDAQMIDVARDTGAGVCAMHMQGTPQTMQDDPQYGNVVEDILAYLNQRRDALQQAGIEHARICLDPGVGFGKTNEHNLQLVAAAGRYHDLGCPVLVGHSRKRFLAKILSDDESDRAAATAGAACVLAQQGVQIIRVHDVRTVRHTLLAFEACGGLVSDHRP